MNLFMKFKDEQLLLEGEISITNHPPLFLDRTGSPDELTMSGEPDIWINEQSLCQLVENLCDPGGAGNRKVPGHWRITVEKLSNE
jgi:hypothetical protein